MSEFVRESRYAVEKWKDLAAALNPTELDMFKHLMWKTHDYRETRGATRYVECVVVEQDWPEFEVAWALIEARMTGQLNPIEELVRAVIFYHSGVMSHGLTPGCRVCNALKAAQAFSPAARSLT